MLKKKINLVLIQKVAFSSFDPSECSNYSMRNRELKNLIKACDS